MTMQKAGGQTDSQGGRGGEGRREEGRRGGEGREVEGRGRRGGEGGESLYCLFLSPLTETSCI